MHHMEHGQIYAILVKQQTTDNFIYVNDILQ
jgi:hypothetical protein